MDNNIQRLSMEAKADAEDLAAELHSWFSVSGDMDDFIYYNEEIYRSEK